MEKIYIDLAKVTKALSDPKRLKIIDMLTQGEYCANNIQSAFDISQPTLSHDMRVLKEAGITVERRVGKNIFYSINKENLTSALENFRTIFGETDTFVTEKNINSRKAEDAAG